MGCTGGRHRSVALAEALARAAGRRRTSRSPSSTGTSSGERASASVVAIGGGHGTAVTLKAARRYAGTLTGVVSVADDGGSSGRLRELLNVVAVGDIRKCLVALADEDSALALAFERRFDEGELAGHALGNLILAGLIDATGDLAGRRARGGQPARRPRRRPAGDDRARRAQGRVGQRHGGRAGGGQGDRRHPDRLAGARATPSRRRWRSSASPRRTRS